jgi:hypothetical protein
VQHFKERFVAVSKGIVARNVLDVLLDSGVFGADPCGINLAQFVLSLRQSRVCGRKLCLTIRKASAALFESCARAFAANGSQRILGLACGEFLDLAREGALQSKLGIIDRREARTVSRYSFTTRSTIARFCPMYLASIRESIAAWLSSNPMM